MQGIEGFHYDPQPHQASPPPGATAGKGALEGWTTTSAQAAVAHGAADAIHAALREALAPLHPSRTSAGGGARAGAVPPPTLPQHSALRVPDRFTDALAPLLVDRTSGGEALLHARERARLRAEGFSWRTCFEEAVVAYHRARGDAV